jgi:hypothetical protein
MASVYSGVNDMAIQRNPTHVAKQRTLAKLIDQKAVADAVSDTATSAVLQAEIERVAAN